MPQTNQQTQDILNNSQEQNLKKLAWHCFKKGVQVGSFLGVAVVTPLLLYKKHKIGQILSMPYFAKSQLYALLFGISASLLLMLGLYYSWQNKAECVKDRVYRIHRNASQTRVDEITLGSFCSSYIVSLFFIKNPLLAIGLTTPGVVGGLLYHALTLKSSIKSQTTQKIQKQEKIQ